MEVPAGISVVFLLITSAFVAAKTFSLWRRTRQTPELLLSVHIFLATVVGYPVTVAANLVSPSEMWLPHVVYPIAMNLGFAFLLLFTLRVFRANALWAKGLVGAMLLVLATCAVLAIREATGENARSAFQIAGLSVANSVPILVAYLWTAGESLSYHRRLRRQQRLGLAAPLVAERMLLWALMCLFSASAVLINGVAMFVFDSFMSPAVVAASSLLGFVQASCLFLAFHPPGWYRSWVERRSAPEVG